MSYRVRTLAVTALLALAGSARAQQKVPRVGVVVALAVNVDAARANSLGAALGAALTSRLVVETVAGEDAANRLPAAGLADDCVAQAACIKDLGQRLDADELLLLVITGAGGGVSIDPTWVDVAANRAVTREAILIDEGEDPGAKFESVAPRLLPAAEVRVADVVPSPSPSAAPRRGRGRHFTTGVWIAGGVSIAALIAGTAFGLSALSEHGSLEDDGCDVTYCSDVDSRVDKMDSRALFADISFGVAAGAGIAAIILYLRSGSEAPVDVAPATDGAMLRLHGRF